MDSPERFSLTGIPEMKPDAASIRKECNLSLDQSQHAI